MKDYTVPVTYKVVKRVMVMLLIIGLAGLGLAGLYWLEGSAAMLTLWGAIGVVCVGAYLINMLRTKLSK